MTGSIGIDVQGSRTALALLESAGDAFGGDALSVAAVGDGRRTLVPHAWTATAWGSAAAEAILAASGTSEASGTSGVSGGPDLGGLLDAWRCGPWDEEFLRGIRRRLDEYTGRTPLTARTYRLAVCADPVTADWPSAAQRLESAGLPDPELVDPATALMCRWLAEAVAEVPDGAVILAAACGETYTVMRSYVMTHAGGRPALRGEEERRIGSGSAEVGDAVARSVLARCRPGAPAAALLALRDGVLEFAAALRARRAGAVEWSGPLSEYLFAPLRLTAAELASGPELGEIRALIRTEAGPLLHGRQPAAVVVGGPGAVWPFPATLLAGTGPVWQSLEPEIDLAVGACWWPRLRSVFGEAATPAGPAGVAGASGASVAGPGNALAPGQPDAAAGSPADTGRWRKPDLSEVPPWRR